MIYLFLPVLVLISPALAKVDSNFKDCKRYFYADTPPQGFEQLPHQNYIVPICQMIKNVNNPFFASLYHTGYRYGLYSAYILDARKASISESEENIYYYYYYHGDNYYDFEIPAEDICFNLESQENINAGRQTFQLEPQLVDQNLPQYMMLQLYLEAEIRKHRVPGNPRDRIRRVQAVNSDYINSGYHKGHLNPCADHPPGDGQTATFTLTNVAPMAPILNRDAWRKNELNVRNIAQQCKIMYVITGVIPGDDWIKGQERINIPSYIWSAFCCLDNNDKPFKAQGFMAENVNNSKVTQYSISDLQSILVAQYKIQNIILFQNNCQKNYILIRNKLKWWIHQ